MLTSPSAIEDSSALGSWAAAGSKAAFLGLLLANIAFLVTFFAYDLSLFQLLLVYWSECLLLGIFNSLKLLTASLFGHPYDNRPVGYSRGSAILLSLLAIFFFVGKYMTFIGMLGIGILLVAQEVTGLELFDLLGEAGEVLALSTVLLAAGHGLSFLINFLVLGEYKNARARQLIFWPYRRALALLGAISVAVVMSIFRPELANTISFVLVLALCKLLADMGLHLMERRKFSSQ